MSLSVLLPSLVSVTYDRCDIRCWMLGRVAGVIREETDHLSQLYPTVTAEAFAAPVALPDPQAMVT